jgi:hypothetical protein
MVPIFRKTESFELKLYGKKDENSEEPIMRSKEWLREL